MKEQRPTEQWPRRIRYLTPECVGFRDGTSRYAKACPCTGCVAIRGGPGVKPLDRPSREADEFVVESFLHGDRMLLNRAEKILVTLHWTNKGMSAAEIARRLGTSHRNVTRFRAEGRK